MEHKQLIPIFLLIIGFQFGEPIKCYDCISSDNSLCKDKFVGHVAESICGNDMVCGKLIIPRPGIPKPNEKVGEDVYTRKCVKKDFCRGMDDISLHCSTCTQNYCNSAKLITPSLTVIASAYIIKLLLF